MATHRSAMLGYQKVFTAFTLRGYAGLDYEGHRLSPANRFDGNSGGHVGGKVRLDVESDFAMPNYVNLIATYSSARDRYWVRARGGRISRASSSAPRSSPPGIIMRMKSAMAFSSMSAIPARPALHFRRSGAHAGRQRGRYPVCDHGILDDLLSVLIAGHAKKESIALSFFHGPEGSG